uniref:Uncharacterized protein n=1 Tax=Chaetoceros debilis TaxID=122233 RepID=A0A7S3Q3T3_9STRA
MTSCSNHSLVTNQLQCILSYDGNAADVRINYTLLFMNLAVACLPFLQSHRQNRQRDVLCALCSLSFGMFVPLFHESFGNCFIATSHQLCNKLLFFLQQQ